jgi:hypothetical protein
MNAIFLDPDMDDGARRRALYDGQVIVYSPRPSSLALCTFAREMSEKAFGALDPREAQHSIPVDQYAAVLPTSPKFIHHPSVKTSYRRCCAISAIPSDVLTPRLRTATDGNYLKSGIAYAFHPHRDTWYSAPFNQINWWLPVYDIEPSNAMAFHLRYWDRPIRNDSRDYNYAEWKRVNRSTAAQYIESDTRQQPRAEEPVELEPEIRLICSGRLILFSGAHLHSTVPNSGYTRFSIDLRTVHVGDARPSGAQRRLGRMGTMGDYLRLTDLAHLPADLIDGTSASPLRSPSTPQPSIRSRQQRSRSTKCGPSSPAPAVSSALICAAA